MADCMEKSSDYVANTNTLGITIRQSVQTIKDINYLKWKRIPRRPQCFCPHCGAELVSSASP